MNGWGKLPDDEFYTDKYEFTLDAGKFIVARYRVLFAYINDGHSFKNSDKRNPPIL